MMKAWYTLALNVFQEFDLDAEDFSNIDKCFSVSIR